MTGEEEQYRIVPQSEQEGAKDDHGDERKLSRTFDTKDTVWSCLVVLSALIIYIIVDGVVFSFGILFIELLQAFAKGKATTAWIGAIMSSTQFLIAPLVALGITRYGCRRVTIIGSVVSFIGLTSSFFCTELYQLYITVGFLGGLGNGLMYLASNVAVIQYFDRRRALAMGIACCGSGLGSVIFNPLVSILISSYGWRGTLLIEGAIVLHGIFCGVVFQPVQQQSDGDGSTTGIPDTGHKGIKPDTPIIVDKEQHGTQGDENTLDDTNCVIEQSSSVPLGCTENGNLPKRLHVSNEDVTQALMYDQYNDGKDENPSQSFEQFQIHDCEVKITTGSSETSLTSVSEEKTRDNQGSAEVAQHQKKFHFSILLDPLCIAFLLCTVFVALGYAVPFGLLPDWTIERGFSGSQAVYVVTALGISNTVSRALVGWLADNPGIHRVTLYKAAILSAGLITMLTPLCHQYWLMMIYACAFGALIGCFVTLCPVVLADMFGADLIAATLGLNFFLIGLAGLVAMPVGAWIFDTTGSYNVSFIVAGSEFFIAGLVLLFPDMRKRCRRL